MTPTKDQTSELGHRPSREADRCVSPPDRAAALPRPGRERPPLAGWYYPGYTGVMKTAVSVPDNVFRAVERLAQRLGLSRSGLYSRALREFLARHDDDEVTLRLNEVYERESSAIDPAISRIAALSLPRESWK